MNSMVRASSSNRAASVVRRSTLTAAIFLFATTSVAGAQQNFQTPAEAASRLVDAVRIDGPSAVLTVLGPGARDIVSSGDSVADAEIRRRFLAAYDEKNQITMDNDDKATMVIGQEGFPFPIPLVRRDGRWRFDTVAGRREILHRRIGRNELHTIEVSLAYVDAQREYAEKDRTGAGVGVYARRFLSQPGRRDGLYWPTSQGEDPSPLGDLFVQASDEGYRLTGLRAPYHGYFYRILTGQGSAARGGAMDYVVRDRMIGGFALVAYPAVHMNTGVMSFIVNHDGVVYQKNLSWHAARIAGRMWFNPDQTWSKVDLTALEQ